jgi:hypothetical protein
MNRMLKINLAVPPSKLIRISKTTSEWYHFI